MKLSSFFVMKELTDASDRVSYKDVFSSREHPSYGGLTPPLPHLGHNGSHMVKDDCKKNRKLIAFFKLFLRDVKVESLLISRHCFCRFSYTPPIRPFIVTPIFTQMKAVRVVHMSCKFHSQLTCTSLRIPKN